MEKANNTMPVGRFIFGFVITMLIFPAVILLLGGDWLWLEGWIFGLWFDAMVLSNMLYLYLKDPALLAEMTLGAPLLLGSLYGLLIGFIGVIVVVGMIIGEENMLVNELAGYEEYQRKVKYRLVPFVW